MPRVLDKHYARTWTAMGDGNQLWRDEGWVFASPTGEVIHQATDYDEWKRLLKLAGVRDGRLHDARHTAATVLLVLGVSGRAVMGIMGWSNPAMAVRYQHMTDQVRRDIAQQLGGLLWGDPPSRPGETGDGPSADRPEQDKLDESDGRDGEGPILDGPALPFVLLK